MSHSLESGHQEQIPSHSPASGIGDIEQNAAAPLKASYTAELLPASCMLWTDVSHG